MTAETTTPPPADLHEIARQTREKNEARTTPEYVEIARLADRDMRAAVSKAIEALNATVEKDGPMHPVAAQLCAGHSVAAGRMSFALDWLEKRVAPPAAESGLSIYLASRYSRHPEMRQVRAQLEALGYVVTSRWINGGHELTKEGSTEANEAERVRYAEEDAADLRAADICLSFTEEPRKTTTRGGRHVEHGMALALGKRTIVVGWRENVFHCLPQVEFFPTLPEALDALARLSPPSTPAQASEPVEGWLPIVLCPTDGVWRACKLPDGSEIVAAFEGDGLGPFARRWRKKEFGYHNPARSTGEARGDVEKFTAPYDTYVVSDLPENVYPTHFRPNDTSWGPAALTTPPATTPSAGEVEALLKAWDKLADHIRPPRVRSEAGTHNGRDDVRVVPTHRLKTFTDKVARVRAALAGEKRTPSAENKLLTGLRQAAAHARGEHVEGLVERTVEVSAEGQPGRVEEAWRCFQCGVVFTDRREAEGHFGRWSHHSPACVVDSDFATLKSQYNQLEADFYRMKARAVPPEPTAVAGRAEEALTDDDVATLRALVFDEHARAADRRGTAGEDYRKRLKELGFRLKSPSAHPAPGEPAADGGEAS